MSRLDPYRWQLASPHLDQALDLDDHARTEWLSALRARDAALAADVEMLLREHGAVRRDQFLEHPVTPVGVAEAPAGTAFGAYTLVSPIGRGGMGTVWLAERNDGRFDRRAAIKLLNAALGSRGEERFRREGRILARLAHPHVSQLLDAGVSASGQPYLVLEHVDGVPIDRYCDERELDVSTRLRLFLDVLDAVAHAHALLIVHRDIKPSNVLVTNDGQVKLLDFGIATLLEDEPGVTTARTVDGTAALTPAYAAPEQVTGQPASTATDVYGLAVLLYVLLAGKHPMDDRLQSPADLVKAIVEMEPARPSDATTPTAAARRTTSPDKLRRILRGDLDTIVGTGLKKVPAERYPSVTALAEDVRRYLRQEPIRARPDAWSYRTGKFLRRNWLAATAAALILAALSGGLYATNRQRAIAERRFTQVRQLANKMLALDEVIRGLPGSTKARHDIVAMSQEYLETLNAEVGDDRELRLEVAVAYSQLARAQGVPSAPNLGLFTEADASLRKAEALLEPLVAAASGDALALATIARVSQDRMILADSGQREDEALALARKAAGHVERWLGSGELSEADRRAATTVLSNVALFNRNKHRFEDAVRYARRVIDVSGSLPSGQVQSGFALSVVADSLRLSGDLEGALRAILESVAMLEKATFVSEAQRMSTWIPVLVRQGLILGEDGGVSASQSDEAMAVLQRAFDLTETWAKLDPNESGSRIQMAAAGRELADILRHRNPAKALEIYDHTRLRLGEIKNNALARRREAEVLARSSYVARQLHRATDARARIDSAFRLLREAKAYPPERIVIDDSADVVLRAEADHLADTGESQPAIRAYDTLLNKTMASKPAPESNLSHALALSRLYDALAGVYDRTGLREQAASNGRLNLELWRNWDRKLPNNAFVRRQLAMVRTF